jgi:broad specificity phosphatase PhoE
MTKLFLVRHGETKWNREGKYTGQTDIPLNKTGKKQAKNAARYLASIQPDVIFSSDLVRALETAQIINQLVKIPIKTDDRLREINQGDWEGMHIDEIKGKFHGLFVSRQNDPLNVASPGGETIGQVYNRVCSVLEEICWMYPDGKVVITAHGIVLAILQIIAVGIPIQDVFEYIPENADVIQIEIEKGCTDETA